MSHLSIDKIIDFVSSSENDAETLSLISEVNQHIRNCPGCFRVVKAFQIMHDEFLAISDCREFRDYYYQMINKEENSDLLKTDEYDYRR